MKRRSRRGEKIKRIGGGEAALETSRFVVGHGGS